MEQGTNTEKTLKSLIEAAPLAVFDLDRQGRVNSIWNEAAEDIFGWSKEEVIGEPLPIVPEDKTEEFEGLQERVFSGETFSGFEVKRERKDGTLIDVSISNAPVRDEEGRIVRILSFLEDITLKKQLERSLKESERKFREIFNNTDDAIFFQEVTEEGEAGQFLEVNEKACEMLGYSREELLTMTPGDIDEGGAERVKDLTEKIASQERFTFESTHVAKDGTRIPVEISAHYFELNGENRALTVARDISRRKAAESDVRRAKERLEAAMESGNLAWWRMKLPSGEVDFSDLKAEMLGYSPEKFEHYSDFTDLIHPEDHEGAMEAMRAHLEGKKERYEVSYRIKKEDGDYKWFRDVGSITADEGEEKVVTGVVVDIDKRKEAELELEEQRGKLRDLHDAVDRFQQCETVEELFNKAVLATENILDFDHCAFYLVKEEKLELVASSEDVAGGEDSSHGLDEGLAGETYQRRKSFKGDDLREEERAEVEDPELRGYMSVPIGDVGVLQVTSYRVGSFGEGDLELSEILAGHLHEEVKRISLEGELKRRAIRDPLTDLYNRRYFNETLKKEIQKAERYEKPLAFLMIDVNDFKEINDRYSHQVGDRVLQEVADLLRENFRDADTVVRYGGDEFLVMMPETNGGVKNTVERLEEELLRWNKESDLLDYPLSLAVGVSHWKPGQDRNVEEALKEADEKMYEKKER